MSQASVADGVASDGEEAKVHETLQMRQPRIRDRVVLEVEGLGRGEFLQMLQVVVRDPPFAYQMYSKLRIIPDRSSCDL